PRFKRLLRRNRRVRVAEDRMLDVKHHEDALHLLKAAVSSQIADVALCVGSSDLLVRPVLANISLDQRLQILLRLSRVGDRLRLVVYVAVSEFWREGNKRIVAAHEYLHFV